MTIVDFIADRVKSIVDFWIQTPVDFIAVGVKIDHRFLDSDGVLTTVDFIADELLPLLGEPHAEALRPRRLPAAAGRKSRGRPRRHPTRPRGGPARTLCRSRPNRRLRHGHRPPTAATTTTTTNTAAGEHPGAAQREGGPGEERQRDERPAGPLGRRSVAAEPPASGRPAEEAGEVRGRRPGHHHAGRGFQRLRRTGGDPLRPHRLRRRAWRRWGRGRDRGRARGRGRGGGWGPERRGGVPAPAAGEGGAERRRRGRGHVAGVPAVPGLSAHAQGGDVPAQAAADAR